MKFVCLGYADMSLFAAMSEAEMAAAMELCFAYDDELRRGGHFLAGEALQPADHAVTIRCRDGNAVPTDGPFAETKEQLGGILFLEAKDLAHAIALMTKHPGVQFGAFEVRPADDITNAKIEARGKALIRSSDRSHEPELQTQGKHAGSGEGLSQLSLLPHVLKIFQDHLGYLQQAVADIPEDRFVEQPQGLVNHPAWTLSHLNLSLRYLLKLLDEPQAGLHDADQRRYGPGSIPTTERGDYASKSMLLTELAQLHTLTHDAVRAKHGRYFGLESPAEIRSFAPTIGEVATYLLATHEAYHLAQINQWRRAANLLSH